MWLTYYSTLSFIFQDNIDLLIFQLRMMNEFLGLDMECTNEIFLFVTQSNMLKNQMMHVFNYEYLDF